MSLHLLPALSLGARLDELQRTTIDLFGESVTIAASTEREWTKPEDPPRPEHIAIHLVVDLRKPFPALVQPGTGGLDLESASAVRQSSAPADDPHTHAGGGRLSLSTTDADGHSIGRPGAASTPFDEACTGQPLSSPWSLEQRRAAELVAQAEEVCGIDAACAVMKEKACLFADSLNAEIEDLRGCRETLQNHVEIRTAERNVAQSRADTLEAVLLEAQRASPSARFLVIDRQRIDKAIEQARAALSSPAAAERSGET